MSSGSTGTLLWLRRPARVSVPVSGRLALVELAAVGGVHDRRPLRAVPPAVGMALVAGRRTSQAPAATTRRHHGSTAGDPGVHGVGGYWRRPSRHAADRSTPREVGPTSSARRSYG